MKTLWIFLFSLSLLVVQTNAAQPKKHKKQPAEPIQPPALVYPVPAPIKTIKPRAYVKPYTGYVRPYTGPLHNSYPAPTDDWDYFKSVVNTAPDILAERTDIQVLREITVGNENASKLDSIAEHAKAITQLVAEIKGTAKLPPLPMKIEWEANMLKYGGQLRDYLRDQTNPEFKQVACFYDAEYVFYQMYDYTKDKQWLDASQLAEKALRDYYILPNNGRIVAWYIHPHGLVEDFIRTGDTKSKNAVNLMATNASFAPLWTPPTATVGIDYAREKAYVTQAYLQNERLGVKPNQERLTLLVNQILDDWDHCFTKKDAPYVKPFFIGLEGAALIEYNRSRPIADFDKWLKLAADGMWPLWNEAGGGLLYTDRVTTEPDDDLKPAPDLNMLILPIYWEYYKISGDDTYRQRAEKLFTGCVSHPNLTFGKQFNQAYRYSIQFVTERVAR